MCWNEIPLCTMPSLSDHVWCCKQSNVLNLAAYIVIATVSTCTLCINTIIINPLPSSLARRNSLNVIVILQLIFGCLFLLDPPTVSEIWSFFYYCSARRYDMQYEQLFFGRRYYYISTCMQWHFKREHIIMGTDFSEVILTREFSNSKNVNWAS